MRALFKGTAADAPAGVDPVALQVLARKSSFQEVSLCDSPR